MPGRLSLCQSPDQTQGYVVIALIAADHRYKFRVHWSAYIYSAVLYLKPPSHDIRGGRFMAIVFHQIDLYFALGYRRMDGKVPPRPASLRGLSWLTQRIGFVPQFLPAACPPVPPAYLRRTHGWASAPSNHLPEAYRPHIPAPQLGFTQSRLPGGIQGGALDGCHRLHAVSYGCPDHIIDVAAL